MPHLADDQLAAADAVADQAIVGLYACCPHMDAAARPMIDKWLLAARGIRLWNHVAHTVSAGQKDAALATQLEKWMRRYQAMWREVSRESELWRIREVCTWYANELR